MKKKEKGTENGNHIPNLLGGFDVLPVLVVVGSGGKSSADSSDEGRDRVDGSDFSGGGIQAGFKRSIDTVYS